MSVETEQTRALSKLIGYLRRQGNQCNAQQPVVPVAGSELLKAADLLEASGIAELTEALRELTDIAQSAVHDDARGDEAAAIFAARDLLAKYCPVPPLPYPPHHQSVMDALSQDRRQPNSAP